ncbi:hypothetical protein HDE_08323 [Halotydeus destructor]|nr:hypothetical protein HDE_08323 [Halotydeus destructor]
MSLGEHRDINSNQFDQWSALEKIRDEVLSECSKEPEKYDTRDLENMQKNINHVKVYTDTCTMTHEENVRNALETLQWRLSVRYHDVRGEDVPREIHNYLHYVEADKIHIVFAQFRRYHKVSQCDHLMTNYLVVAFRKFEDMYLANNKQWILVNNLGGASLANNDIAMTMLIVNMLFKYFVGMMATTYQANEPFLLKPISLFFTKAAPTKYSSKLQFVSGKRVAEILGDHVLHRDIGGTNDKYRPVLEYGRDEMMTTDEICRLHNIKQSNVDKLKRLWNPLTNI